MEENKNRGIDVCTPIPLGQKYARTRWHSHESGEAFDRKKTTFLTEKAQQFIAQQPFYVIAGLGPHGELDGRLVMGEIGSVRTPDEHTCVLHMGHSMEHVGLLQGFWHSFLRGYTAQPGLFFISHSTRERLCVQGSVKKLIANSPNIDDPLSAYENIRVLMHVERVFFHCSKYIRTRVAGLTIPVASNPAYKKQLSVLHNRRQYILSREVSAFISQQVLCFLCTVDADGQCAVNHRGGAAGFLVTLPPAYDSPGGTILVPDYTGNGAFEAIGNILETGLATLLIPNYVAQLAVQVSGTARILEMDALSPAVTQRCIGAERVLALSVQRVELQSGDWSAALAYENAFAKALLTTNEATDDCSL